MRVRSVSVCSARGELRVVSGRVVQADVEGDGDADFEIFIGKQYAFTVNDFIL